MNFPDLQTRWVLCASERVANVQDNKTSTRTSQIPLFFAFSELKSLFCLQLGRAHRLHIITSLNQYAIRDVLDVALINGSLDLSL